MNTDSLIIDIQSTAKDSTKNIDSLVESLENLSKVLSDVISQSNSFKNLKNITSSVKSSNNISQQNIGTESRDAQLRQLKVGDFKSLEKNLLSETTSMDKVISKYKTSMGGIVTITEKATSAGQKFNVTLKQTHPQVKTLSEQLKNAQNVMSKVHAKMVALGASLIGMVKKAVDFVDMASAEAEALNLFTVSMGEYAEEGARWLEKFSNTLYLDPVSVQQYMGSFNSLVKGLGVGSENAYKMSKNLTQLVYDLSSFKNISIESSYEKLMSGISGELEPLRNVGVAMSEATLQTLAYDLGIEKLVRNMTEAEKAQLRYIQIMRSSIEWQTDMGRTLITPANALRVMRQQFVQLGRAIGKVFIPIIMEAMPYVIAMTQILSALAQKLANLLGYEIADIDYSGLGDISAGITDIGTSADKTAEKLNTMLAPFDDLNVVQNQAKNASSGLGGIGGDLGIDLPEYDALANLNEKFAEGVENAKRKLEDIIPVLSTIGGIILGWKVAKDVVDFFTFWDKIGLSATKVIGLTLGIAGISMILQGTAKLQNEDTFWEGLGLKLGGTMAISGATYMFTKNIGISLYITGVSLILQGVKDMKNDKTMWLGIGESLGGSLSVGFGTLMLTKNVTLSLAVTALSIWLAVGAAIKDLISLEPTWQEISDAINEIFGNIPYAVVDACFEAKDKIVKFFENLGTEIPKKWDEFWLDLGNKFDNEKQQWSENWSEFKQTISGMWTIMTDDISKKWNDFWSNAGNTLNENKDKWSKKFEDIKTNISTKWSETWSNVKKTMSTKWSEAKSWFSSNFGTKEDWKKKFNSILTGATSVLSDLKSKFENWKAKIKTPHLEWSDSNSIKAKGVVKTVLEALNLPTSIPKLNVSWYAEGGYPTSGELFFANENGMPEMVGRIGNQTAVANNDQITTSITNALMSALNQYDFGGGKSPTTIYIGNKKVYEGYGDYVADENDRYGTNMIKI